MEILTPAAIRTERQQATSEAQGRVRSLADEESRLVTSVNTLRVIETEERERMVREAGEEESRLNGVISGLTKEVSTLEQRKAEALKPLDDRSAALDARETALNLREEGFATREAAIDTAEKANLEAGRANVADNDALKLREEAVVEREKNEDAREEAARESTALLESKWTLFHKATAEADSAMEKREQAVHAGEVANAARADELEKVAKKNDDDKRQIASNYAALAAATEHTKP